MDDYATAVTPNDPDRGRRADDVSAPILLGALVLIAVLVLWNSKALTPDVVYHAAAQGYDFVFGLASLTAAGIILAGAVHLKARGPVITGSAVTASWFCIVWTFACSMPYDPQGAHNPYMRRLDPLPEQYETLLSARSMPLVVRQIRQAAADGRVDRGEAHDILEGETYLSAASDAMKRRRDRTRRMLLQL